MEVTSNKFGTGTLISEENGKATIDFNGETKSLIVAFAGLTLEDGSKFEASTVAVESAPKKTYKVSAAKKEAKRMEKLSVCASYLPGENPFENEDGSKNWDAVNAFEEERKAAAWASKSF